MYIQVRDRDGRPIRRLPDPAASGTFEAAGDFDRFFDDSCPGYPHDLTLPILKSIDPFADTEMSSDAMPELMKDIAKALTLSKEGPERGGLMRLRVLAETCAATPGSKLIWWGY